MKYDFQGYLEAKRSVDLRAFNHGVWEMLAARLGGVRDVLDVGCGTGAMFDRLAEAGGLAVGATYLGVDTDDRSLAVAGARLPAGKSPFSAVRFERADLFDLQPVPSYDLVVAAAFLDLVDLPRALERLLALLRPGGFGYFPINFDGLTVFEPSHPLDGVLIPAYHETIHAGGGDSRAGRRLFGALRQAGAVLLGAGASDWLVYPGADGAYPGREGYFLEHILLFFEDALKGHPGIEAAQLEPWLAARRAQIARGDLVYIAHQLDFLVQKAEPSAAGGKPAVPGDE